MPAIEYGKHDGSLDTVVKIMVLAMRTRLIKRNISWKKNFIIQPDERTVYDEFCKQLLSTRDVTSYRKMAR